MDMSDQPCDGEPFLPDNRRKLTEKKNSQLIGVFARAAGTAIFGCFTAYGWSNPSVVDIASTNILTVITAGFLLNTLDAIFELRKTQQQLKKTKSVWGHIDIDHPYTPPPPKP